MQNLGANRKSNREFAGTIVCSMGAASAIEAQQLGIRQGPLTPVLGIILKALKLGKEPHLMTFS